MQGDLNRPALFLTVVKMGLFDRCPTIRREPWADGSRDQADLRTLACPACPVRLGCAQSRVMKPESEQTFESPVEPSASAQPGASGRRVVLLVLLFAPLLIIPLLLTGKVHETQVCMETLQRREATYWVVGSYRLTQPEWQPVPDWPKAIDHEGFFTLLGEPLVADPADFPWPAFEEEHWETLSRSQPLTVFMSIENSKALPERRRNLLELRLLMATVLEPGDASAMKCLSEIEQVLRPRDVVEPLASGRKRRHRPPTEAENIAHQWMTAAQHAFNVEGTPEAVAQSLCDFDRNLIDQTNLAQ